MRAEGRLRNVGKAKAFNWGVGNERGKGGGPREQRQRGGKADDDHSNSVAESVTTDAFLYSRRNLPPMKKGPFTADLRSDFPRNGPVPQPKRVQWPFRAQKHSLLSTPGRAVVHACCAYHPSLATPSHNQKIKRVRIVHPSPPSPTYTVPSRR